MAYKTILVHVDHSPQSADRIRIAADIALAENAHLIGTAMTGISRFLYEDHSILVESRIEMLCERANQSLIDFEAIVKQIGVPSYEKRLINDDPAEGLVLQARYSDLVVISQKNFNEFDPSLVSNLPEYVTLQSVRPILIVPYESQSRLIANRILIAWDGSMSSTRAISNALPLLKRAQDVTVVVFNPAAQLDVHGELPGADIALYLARHGVKVDVLPQENESNIGSALMALASDQGYDFVVMGGYGHARLREIILGGVTLTVLGQMSVPILMSH
ncbi:universal stress protein [Herminiimonas sp. NPDC097707]|uniref:universal stress protein n=1 Tax=Herminiimonas sp. NPDC097707 TaxID=3364007 RepID=UPI00383B7D9B